MDELLNRSRTFAEAVVTMVWLVLLALALNKPKWKSGVPGLDIPNYMIFLAVSTIITGICPLLSCCVLENFRVISNVAAFFSAAILFFLANWIASFTISDDDIVFWIIGMFVACMVFRIISNYYSVGIEGDGHPVRTKEFHTILDGSHELSCCMTGIHFLWLESFALGALINESHGIQYAPLEVMGIANIICCAIGLCTMYIQMTPPLTSTEVRHIAGSILWFDIFMIFSIVTVLGAAMWKLLVFQRWLLIVIILGPLIVFFVLVLHVSSPEVADENNPNGDQHNEEGGVDYNEPPKLAPLGLTKLMVTGFLTISITSVDSPDVGIINWFLVFAAAAIVSGLTWRFLTQVHVSKMLEDKEQATPVTEETIDEIAALASSANTVIFGRLYGSVRCRYSAVRKTDWSNGSREHILHVNLLATHFHHPQFQNAAKYLKHTVKS